MQYVINVGHTQENLQPVCGCMSVEHGKQIIEEKYQDYSFQEICLVLKICLTTK